MAITAYTRSPLYGADPTPTPDVSTVPRPGQLFTPTPTPSPVIVIITREAPNTSATPNAPTAPDEGPAASQPAIEILTTTGNSETTGPQPLLTANQPASGSAATVTGTSAGGVAALTLSVQSSQVLIWPGALLQLHFVVTNRGETPLNQLEVQQALAPTLHYVVGTLDQVGSIQSAQTLAQGMVLTMRWEQLAQGAEATATITLQVRQDTPNGLFVDQQIVAQSAEGATAVVDLTLVMPPTTLPQFR